MEPRDQWAAGDGARRAVASGCCGDGRPGRCATRPWRRRSGRIAGGRLGIRRPGTSRHQTDRPMKDAAKTVEAPPTPASEPRILVVDDETSMREMLRIVLRRDGYQ